MDTVFLISVPVIAIIAIVLAIRAGGLKSKLTKVTVARDIATEGLHKLSNEVMEENLRHQKEIADLRQEIEVLYDDLEGCGDDATRGRVATRAILRMLSPEEEPGDSDGGTGMSH